MNYKAGDVVMIPFPFIDRPIKKLRPALVLSNNPDGEKKQIPCSGDDHQCETKSLEYCYRFKRLADSRLERAVNCALEDIYT